MQSKSALRLIFHFNKSKEYLCKHKYSANYTSTWLTPHTGSNYLSPKIRRAKEWLRTQGAILGTTAIVKPYLALVSKWKGDEKVDKEREEWKETLR